VAELRKASELDPDLPDAHYTLGVTLWQQGDFPSAAEELRAVDRERQRDIQRDAERRCRSLQTGNSDPRISGLPRSGGGGGNGVGLSLAEKDAALQREDQSTLR